MYNYHTSAQAQFKFRWIAETDKLQWTYSHFLCVSSKLLSIWDGPVLFGWRWRMWFESAPDLTLFSPPAATLPKSHTFCYLFIYFSQKLMVKSRCGSRGFSIGRDKTFKLKCCSQMLLMKTQRSHSLDNLSYVMWFVETMALDYFSRNKLFSSDCSAGQNTTNITILLHQMCILTLFYIKYLFLVLFCYSNKYCNYWNLK